MRRRDDGQALIDLDSDDNECKSKRPRTTRGTAAKTSGSSKMPSFYDNLPQNRSTCNATSRRNKANQDKLDTDIFELYMEDLWMHIDEDKKSAYTYFDSLWFNMYSRGFNKSNVLKWIKAKKIFSREYVFVPIVCWGHWSLLVLCHFDETNCSDAKKGPRMILLDSLNTTDPSRLQSDIRRFIVDIYKTEEREESKQFINKIRLEFPKVPQQNGEDCGIYVLYFIHCFLQNKNLTEVLQNKKLEEDFGQLFDDDWFNPEELENFRKDIHAFQANRNNKTEE
ncbi:probable ubiquitin-like-specific protease 2B [Phragmites australis]|uniref:probable ubiquitin-like-specific protease 2B n=1 Tax=Phragmites australis TaxID=29695 RepID=UPI002D794354|nr:probable ubiquitin-like-specific protease 2B [Phragmites australis]XP_062183077.1 probable ubiquitin-like-specific protease 2B [Phragmites australis]